MDWWISSIVYLFKSYCWKILFENGVHTSSISISIIRGLHRRYKFRRSYLWWHHGPLLLTWLNSNPNMEMPSKLRDEITYPFTNGTTGEVWKWITNFFPNIIMNVITCPSWDQTKSMVEKGAPCVTEARYIATVCGNIVTTPWFTCPKHISIYNFSRLKRSIAQNGHYTTCLISNLIAT